jgi:flagellar assembly protein FliH
MGEADIAPGDCRLEWADGGMVRDRAATEALISEAVARYLTALRGDKNGIAGGS